MKKEYTPPPWDPFFSRSVARPRGRRAKKAMVYTIFLGKQGKRVYTIGPERRVYTIEPQTRKKKKRRVSTVVVYTCFLPVLLRPQHPSYKVCRAEFADLYFRKFLEQTQACLRAQRCHDGRSQALVEYLGLGGDCVMCCLLKKAETG